MEKVLDVLCIKDLRVYESGLNGTLLCRKNSEYTLIKENDNYLKIRIRGMYPIKVSLNTAKKHFKLC